MDQKEIEAVAGPIAISPKELHEFGCPYCGYQFGYASMGAIGGGGVWLCGDSGCGRSCVVLSEGVTKSPVGFRYGEEIIYPELQEHPRRGIPAHGKPDK